MKFHSLIFVFLSANLFIFCLQDTKDPDSNQKVDTDEIPMTVEEIQASNWSPKQLFDALIKKFNRKYGDSTHPTSEYLSRFLTFGENLNRMINHHILDKNAQHGMNKFFDLSKEEFRAQFHGLTLSPHSSVVSSANLVPPMPLKTSLRNGTTPSAWDWRDQGVVAPVKNQKLCGSCWAFCTVAAIESHWALHGHTLTPLSEQQIVSCDDSDDGCGGGLPSRAMDYVISAGGLEAEASYPYTESGKCKFTKGKVVAQIHSFATLDHDEDKMASYLYENGPVTIGVNAEWLQFYQGGVSDPVICSAKDLDHGVTLVGYGVSKTNETYWIVRNSWGSDWGQSGYFMLARGKNKCGVAEMPVAPVV